MTLSSLREDREDVFLTEQDELFAVDLDLGARVLAEEDLVPLLHVERQRLAVLERLARPDGHDDALEGLLLGGVRDDDPALGLLLFLSAPDDEAIGQRSNFHVSFSFLGPLRGRLLALDESECQKS